MISLALIGFFGGLITGISPCILPVLPVIFFSGGVQGARKTKTKGAVDTKSAASKTASGDGAVAVTVKDDVEEKVAEPSRWRPYLVILGLVVSFSLFTLVGSLILGLLGLPGDVLRWAGLIVLLLIGIGLIIPKFEAILEKPFSWIPQKNVNTERGGFFLGIALGAVYVPCAGPVLAAITVAGSTGRIGVETVVLTVTFALGAAIPLLFFALAGRRVAERVKSFRKHQRKIRVIGGVTMIALAIGLVFNVPQAIQRLLPDYTAALQDQFNNSEEVAEALGWGGIVNEQNKNLDKCDSGATELQSCGTAPDIQGITDWFNTPNNEAIDLKDLEGQVVLIDFWAYSCINCQRSIPHSVAWNEAYEDAGLQVIGIHSPEYAFEKELRNVKAGAEDFGITYPVALDNSLSTWTNYRNRYWPAHYLIDAEGTVRHVKFGEGGYETTEKLIRELLLEANPDAQLPGETDTDDVTPELGSTTPETFLGSTKAVNFGGTEAYTAGERDYTFPEDQSPNTFALDGAWKLETQSITPQGEEATIGLEYEASEVRVVLSGSGTVEVNVDGEMQTIEVDGTPRSYELYKGDAQDGRIELTVGAGVSAFSFTFG
ncbi:cytochrome c biogenesis protein DipZ [Humidisolicoccus flavus]|uniref:cytochrome c biogenesis protein DipZ n=1 Tax=Humidisolicoccus flavus TaxID=3111414 RepID=UPI00324DD880